MPILLGGLATLAAAEVSGADRAAGALFLVLASAVGRLVPLLWYLLARRRATRGLKVVHDWLGLHPGSREHRRAGRLRARLRPEGPGRAVTAPLG